MHLNWMKELRIVQKKKIKKRKKNRSSTSHLPSVVSSPNLREGLTLGGYVQSTLEQFSSEKL